MLKNFPYGSGSRRTSEDWLIWPSPGVVCHEVSKLDYSRSSVRGSCGFWTISNGGSNARAWQSSIWMSRWFTSSWRNDDAKDVREEVTTNGPSLSLSTLRENPVIGSPRAERSMIPRCRRSRSRYEGYQSRRNAVFLQGNHRQVLRHSSRHFLVERFGKDLCRLQELNRGRHLPLLATTTPRS